jgi:aryl-alcohol dehydrogenase-like predicted oxidoreductase
MLPGTEFELSKFIFGTASLFNCGGAAQRRALLEAAAEGGFSHFDTAPYYGFGMAERDLAPVLRAYPELTVTTKVGIYSPGGEDQRGWSIFLRKAGGKIFPALSRPVIDFGVARAQKSLEGSLRRLGRETIDLYTLHEPVIDLLQTDEFQSWLETRRARGQIRWFGLALTADRLEPFLKINSPLAQVVQMSDSFDLREADLLARYGRPMQITYAYISAARRAGETSAVSELLNRAIQRNPCGAVIVSTTRPERAGQYRALLEGLS